MAKEEKEWAAPMNDVDDHIPLNENAENFKQFLSDCSNC